MQARQVVQETFGASARAVLIGLVHSRQAAELDNAHVAGSDHLRQLPDRPIWLFSVDYESWPFCVEPAGEGTPDAPRHIGISIDAITGNKLEVAFFRLADLEFMPTVEIDHDGSHAMVATRAAQPTRTAEALTPTPDLPFPTAGASMGSTLAGYPVWRGSWWRYRVQSEGIYAGLEFRRDVTRVDTVADLLALDNDTALAHLTRSIRPMMSPFVEEQPQLASDWLVMDPNGVFPISERQLGPKWGWRVFMRGLGGAVLKQPAVVGDHWAPGPGGAEVWSVESSVPRLVVAAGTFRDCVWLGYYVGAGDHTSRLFCPGVGFVRECYRSHFDRWEAELEAWHVADPG